MSSNENVDSFGQLPDSLPSNSLLSPYFKATLLSAVILYCFSIAFLILFGMDSLTQPSSAFKYAVFLSVFTGLSILPWAILGRSALKTRRRKHHVLFSIITLLLIFLWNLTFAFPSIHKGIISYMASFLFLFVQYAAEAASVIALGILMWSLWKARSGHGLVQKTEPETLNPEVERSLGFESSTHVEPLSTATLSIPDSDIHNPFDQSSILSNHFEDFDERRFSSFTSFSRLSDHWQNESEPAPVGWDQDHNPRDSMQSREQGEGDSESSRGFRDTLSSDNTFTSLPSYHTQPSASQTPYNRPPLLPILPSPSAFTSAVISRQLSTSTLRSDDPPPQDHNPRESMQSGEQGEGDSESSRGFRDTLASDNTFTSLPSYHTQPSAPQTPYGQPPPLPILPSPSAFTSAAVSRQLSMSTFRSDGPPPSYRA